MKNLLVSTTFFLCFGVFSTPASSALIDTTVLPWNFNARIFDGALGFNSVFGDSLLLFEQQTAKSGGGAFVGGQIFWEVSGATVAVTNFVGELFTDKSFILIGDTGGLLTAFRGLITGDGELIVGELGGFGGSDLHGFFWATPVDLPPSGLMMALALALGAWAGIGSLRRGKKDRSLT